MHRVKQFSAACGNCEASFDLKESGILRIGAPVCGRFSLFSLGESRVSSRAYIVFKDGHTRMSSFHVFLVYVV